jgi:hypothetical protein
MGQIFFNALPRFIHSFSLAALGVLLTVTISVHNFSVLTRRYAPPGKSVDLSEPAPNYNKYPKVFFIYCRVTTGFTSA